MSSHIINPKKKKKLRSYCHDQRCRDTRGFDRASVINSAYAPLLSLLTQMIAEEVIRDRLWLFRNRSHVSREANSFRLKVWVEHSWRQFVSSSPAWRSGDRRRCRAFAHRLGHDATRVYRFYYSCDIVQEEPHAINIMLINDSKRNKKKIYVKNQVG